LVAVAVEGSQLLLVDRHPDPTNVLIAAVSAWVALRIVRRLRWLAPAALSASQPAAAIEPVQNHAHATFNSATTADGGQFSAALAAAAAIIALSYMVPGNPVSTALAVMAYTACIWRHPQTALFLVPITLGLTDLATTIGPRWLDTLDLAMVATGVVAVAHPLASQPVNATEKRRLPGSIWMLLGLIPGTLIGLGRLDTLDPIALLTPLDSAWGAMQSKGLIWSIVLALFARRLNIRAEAAGLMLGRGMVVALAGVILLTVKERLAFVGPFDFSSDYRAPGPFSAIALGGAYIECFLATAVPFAVVATIRERRRWIRWGCALVVLGAAYTTMITFSRGGQVVFLAVVSATVLLLAARPFAGMHRERRPADKWKSALLVCAVGSIAGVVLLAPYATARFDALGADAGVRLAHWREGLAYGSSDTSVVLFGNGMGSFGRQAYVLGDLKSRPGTFELMHQDGNTWLQSRPGALSYLDQRVDVQYAEPLRVSARLRGTQGSGIEVLL
ncbi:MAG: hypothetical protein K2X42_00260, partial [Burkholderiaceae bacterium]|nr:hypothetical protein [Burkholderiaceae bacterium]